MSTVQEALSILNKNKISNAGFINFLQGNLIFSIDIMGESVICRGKSDREWLYICCSDKEELYTIKSKLKIENTNFAAIEDWMRSILMEGKEVIWDLSAIQYYLPDEIDIKPGKNNTVKLKVEDANIVYNNSTYQNYITIDYIKERIQKGISAGIYEDDKLVSWSITQDDGAIGFLHTLKDYRLKGYGKDVILSVIDKLRAVGQLPFAYVEESNKKPREMLLNLGFKENKKVHWFQIK